MSIIYNGTTLTDIVYNGVSLDKVIYNGVTVFEKVSVIREPVSGEYFSSDLYNYSSYVWLIDFWSGSARLFWNNVKLSEILISKTEFSIGGFTYYRGSKKLETGDGSGYGIYRIKN